MANLNIGRLIKTLLLVFHGQLLAVGVYDLIIHGAIDLGHRSKNDLFFDIGRVVIGSAMVTVAVYSLLILWRHKFKLLYTSAIALTLVFSAYVVIYVIHLTLNFGKLSNQTRILTITEFVIKSSLMAIASFLSFFLAARGSYHYVHST
jgi:hypothetical protein